MDRKRLPASVQGIRFDVAGNGAIRRRPRRDIDVSQIRNAGLLIRRKLSLDIDALTDNLTVGSLPSSLVGGLVGGSDGGPILDTFGKDLNRTFVAPCVGSDDVRRARDVNRTDDPTQVNVRSG